jgi:hypothetical protein
LLPIYDERSERGEIEQLRNVTGGTQEVHRTKLGAALAARRAPIREVARVRAPRVGITVLVERGRARSRCLSLALQTELSPVPLA